MSQEKAERIKSFAKQFNVPIKEVEDFLAFLKERTKEETVIEKIVKETFIKCRTCGGKCTPGKVLKNETVVSSSDEFGGTMSDRGFPQILNCFKCESCGHSFISKKF